MSDLIKKEILEDINKANQVIVEKVGAKLVLSKIVNTIVGGAKKCIQDANSTDSVDERIKILVTGIQEIVTYVEREAEKNDNHLELLQNRVGVLKEIVQKFEKINIDEKKMADPEVKED